MDKYKKTIFDYDYWYDLKMDKWFERFVEFTDEHDLIHIDHAHDVLMDMLKEIGTEIDKELSNEHTSSNTIQ